MNKWKEVACVFELELGEEFYIEGDENCIYKFTEKGLCGRTKQKDSEFYEKEEWLAPVSLCEIIENSEKVIKKPWKPKVGERYCYYSSTACFSVDADWKCDHYDLSLWKSGNCFRTYEEALTKGKEVVDKLKKEYENA